MKTIGCIMMIISCVVILAGIAIAGGIEKNTSQSTIDGVNTFMLFPASKDTIAEMARVMKDQHNAELKVALYEYNDITQMWDRARPDGCLAKMEAAMRAMSPYLNEYREDGSVLHSLYKGAPSSVMQQWDAAKSCWRKP